MSGHQKFSNLTQSFSTQRKAKIAAKKTQLYEEVALDELRQDLKISQTELAAKLKVKQPAISLLEKRTDMYVSHLRQVIQAMGGELEIVARFRDSEVKIENFSEFTSK
ncbi:MAG: XRE family transcriptional regulator [Spirulinaceae cyanobacterium]